MKKITRIVPLAILLATVPVARGAIFEFPVGTSAVNYPIWRIGFKC